MSITKQTVFAFVCVWCATVGQNNAHSNEITATKQVAALLQVPTQMLSTQSYSVDLEQALGFVVELVKLLGQLSVNASAMPITFSDNAVSAVFMYSPDTLGPAIFEISQEVVTAMMSVGLRFYLMGGRCELLLSNIELLDRISQLNTSLVKEEMLHQIKSLKNKLDEFAQMANQIHPALSKAETMIAELLQLMKDEIAKHTLGLPSNPSVVTDEKLEVNSVLLNALEQGTRALIRVQSVYTNGLLAATEKIQKRIAKMHAVFDAIQKDLQGDRPLKELDLKTDEMCKELKQDVRWIANLVKSYDIVIDKFVIGKILANSAYPYTKKLVTNVERTVTNQRLEEEFISAKKEIHKIVN